MRGADAEASRLILGVCCTAGLVSVASLMLGAVFPQYSDCLINADVLQAHSCTVHGSAMVACKGVTHNNKTLAVPLPGSA